MTASLAAARRVHVRLPNWLGDVLMARPFLAALRRAAPSARIVAIGPAAPLALLAGDSAWDDAVAWPVADRAALAAAGRADVAFVLPPSFSSALFAWSSGARERIGYAGEGRSPLLTRALRRLPRGERHVAREYLALLGDDAAAHEHVPLPPALALGADAIREADEARAAADAGARPFAIVAPGAAYGAAKRWPVARFADVARALAADGLAVLACGSARDADDADALVRECAGAAVSLAGRTSLAAQAALCARAEVVVSNDSGMAHLAAAVGAPTVAVFGSTSSAWTAPLGARVRIVQRPTVCSPCFQRDCAIGVACLTAVRTNDVLAAVASLRPARALGGAA